MRGKRVVVTGAAKGIGAKIAEAFAAEGADVVIDYLTSQEQAEALAERIGGTAVCADVTVRAEVEALMAEGVDVLVNNAGIYPVKPFLEITDDEWRAMLDANLTATYVATQVAAKHMVDRGVPGAIINVTSIEAHAPGMLHAHYSAAKGGVTMLTKASALELGSHGIRVNAVAPGLIEYPELRSLWPEGVERWLKASPLARLGTGEDVAAACVFLAGPDAAFITGTTLFVDGGVSATPAF